MSILIKGIDLPERNEFSDEGVAEFDYYAIREDGAVYRMIPLGDAKYSPYWIGNRMAIQIDRPHGRLGDLDILLEESLKEGAYNYVDSWQIAEQPTILEAEE